MLGWVGDIELNTVGAGWFCNFNRVGRWFRSFFVERIGGCDWEFKLFGENARGGDPDDFASGVLHTNDHRANDIESISQAAGDNVFSCCILRGEGAGDDGQLEVGLNNEELFNQSRVADVSKLGGWGAGLGEASFNASCLGGVLLVGCREAVELSVGGGLDSEITHGESTRGWFSWLDSHGGWRWLRIEKFDVL